MSNSLSGLGFNRLIWFYCTLLAGKYRPKNNTLYWNETSTRLPPSIDAYYLHLFYRAKRLDYADDLVSAERQLDLHRITSEVMRSVRLRFSCPSYIQISPSVNPSKRHD